MKCPICGKEEFIKAPYLPFSVSGDASLDYSGCDCYSCTGCGYTIFINKEIRNYVYSQKEAISLIKKLINEKKEVILKLQSSSSDVSSLQDQLNKYREYLRIKKEMGEDNKSTRALEESIKELSEEVACGFNKGELSAITNLKKEIANLENQIKNIEKTIEPRLSANHKKTAIKEQDYDGERVWNILTSVYQKNDSLNNNTISISKTITKSSYELFRIIKKVKEQDYRPFGYDKNGKTIVVLDETEKNAFGNTPYQTVLTIDEFLKER